MKVNEQDNTQTNSNYEKKTKKAFAIRLTLCMLAGMILGIILAIGTPVVKEILSDLTQKSIEIMPTIQLWIFPWLLLIFTLFCIVKNELFLKQARHIIETWDGEDDAHINKANTSLNKVSLYSNILSIGASTLFAFITYNLLDNLDSVFGSVLILITVAIYFFGLFFITYQQNRMLKLVKKYAPEKQGSIYDKKFQEIWLASCDEGERLIIYQATYKTYNFMINFLTILLTITTILGMFFPIGILCSILIGGILLVMTIYYVVVTMKLEDKI